MKIFQNSRILDFSTKNSSKNKEAKKIQMIKSDENKPGLAAFSLKNHLKIFKGTNKKSALKTIKSNHDTPLNNETPENAPIIKIEKLEDNVSTPTPNKSALQKSAKKKVRFKDSGSL